MALLPINWEHKIKPGKYEISVSSPLVFRLTDFFFLFFKEN